MTNLILRLRDLFGTLGIVAVGLLLASAAFFLLVVQPLQDESDRLDRRLKSAARTSTSSEPKLVKPAAPLAGFYGFFEREERVEDWLSKLYASALSSGLEFRAAEYRLAGSQRRLERYQISLPIAGSYPQVRMFMESALVEIPIMSIDQVTFRRKSINDPRVDAEIVVTLHVARR